LGPKINEYLQTALNDLTNTTTNLTLSQILDRCNNDDDEGGESVYTLFNLSQIYDVQILSNWEIDYDIETIIKQLDNTIQVSYAGLREMAHKIKTHKTHFYFEFYSFNFFEYLSTILVHNSTNNILL
jgi:hypothetical protein